MPKPNLTVIFDHDETRVDVLSRTILSKICLFQVPRRFQ